MEKKIHIITEKSHTNKNFFYKLIHLNIIDLVRRFAFIFIAIVIF